jgi:hypothetical protein
MELIYQDYENDKTFYKLYVDTTEKYFCVQLVGDLGFEFNKKTNLKFLEFVEQYQYSSFIYNLSEQSSSAVKSRIWYVSYVVKRGYRILRGKQIKAAMVHSSNPLESAMLNILMRAIVRLIPSVNMKAFPANSLEEAKEWIITNNKNLETV